MNSNLPTTKSKGLLFKLLRGCLLFLGCVFFLSIVFLYYNWGLWRPLSYELTGVEFPLEQVYMTDISDRGREAGYYITVYRVPDDIQQRLLGAHIELSEYPIFVAGLERDGYKRINWALGFPRNMIEKHIFQFFEQDIEGVSVPALEAIVNDDAAECLANHLLKLPNTYCCGWYKQDTPTDGICLGGLFFYVLNLEKSILIKFGLVV